MPKHPLQKTPIMDGPPNEEVQGDPLAHLANQAYLLARQERDNQIEGNAARFKRGQIALELQALSKAIGLPTNQLLEDVNKQLTLIAAENMDTEEDIGTISENEATMTASVVKAFGSDGTFLHIFGKNRATGEPMVDDNGTPRSVPITSVPINKLYALTSFLSDADYDTLASFAKYHGERTVKRAAGISKSKHIPIQQVIEFVNKVTEPRKSPLTGLEIQVKAPEKAILKKMDDLAPARLSEIVNIPTVRTFFDGAWRRIKNTLTALAEEYDKGLLQGKGNTEVSNMYVFERLLVQYFDPAEGSGTMRIMEAVLNAGDFTPQQIDAFLKNHRFDADTAQWSKDAPEEEQLDKNLATAELDDWNQTLEQIAEGEDLSDEDFDF